MRGRWSMLSALPSSQPNIQHHIMIAHGLRCQKELVHTIYRLECYNNMRWLIHQIETNLECGCAVWFGLMEPSKLSEHIILELVLMKQFKARLKKPSSWELPYSSQKWPPLIDNQIRSNLQNGNNRCTRAPLPLFCNSDFFVEEYKAWFLTLLWVLCHEAVKGVEINGIVMNHSTLIHI